MNIADSELVDVLIILIGGPLDGAEFRAPKISGSAPSSMSVPLKQPASSSSMTRYVRSERPPVDAFIEYHFDECQGPDREGVLYAPDQLVPPCARAGANVSFRRLADQAPVSVTQAGDAHVRRRIP